MTFFDQNAYRREVEHYAPLLARVNRLEPEYRQLGDTALRDTTGRLKKRLQEGETLEDLIPEAFAAVREAGLAHDRPAPLRCADHRRDRPARGAIAEMRTGEGKTLVATLPLYLTALEAKAPTW